MRKCLLHLLVCAKQGETFLKVIAVWQNPIIGRALVQYFSVIAILGSFPSGSASCAFCLCYKRGSDVSRQFLILPPLLNDSLASRVASKMLLRSFRIWWVFSVSQTGNWSTA